MRLFALLIVTALAATGCATETTQEAGTSPAPETTSQVTIYSGRSEDLVGPVIDLFEEETGITTEVRYGDTAELAATILEEGENSPADVFFAQDAGALGAVAKEGRFSELPQDLLDQVPQGFRSPDGLWVGTSGRARVLVYNTEALNPDELPTSVLDLTKPEWEGRVGWAPTNGSFQAFVTALRLVEGEDVARAWLEGMKENDAQVYPKNTPIVQAVAAGEIDAGLVNHYYLLELSDQDPGIAERAANGFFAPGDPGNLVNAAGVGILESSERKDAAQRFVEFLLSRTGDQYFSEETFEYPLTGSAERDPRLPPLDEVGSPELDLSDLEDLRGTLELLREVGVL